MGYPAIPPERIDELKVLAEKYQPSSKYALGLEDAACDFLKQELDQAFTSDMSDPAAAAYYFYLLVAALIKGCGFINANPAHTDPTNGDPFQFQACAGADARGTKLQVADDGYLSADAINRRDNVDPATDLYDLFKFVPTNERHNGYPAFRIVVNTGRNAGKVLEADTSLTDQKHRPTITARDWDPARPDQHGVWIRGDLIDVAGGGGAGYRVRYFSPGDRTDMGCLIDPEGRNSFLTFLEHANDNWAWYLWHFRPANYTD
ncbi:hypothetical protein ABTZ03_44100 [Kitasatospora sp. NPDC096077]|uniref:hypothetical protein n=1 Tax=Kitasatospora sp. NPDC096077 TaxID=3155544 RepID=UPI0033243424